jgi:hypothetical protein
MAAKGDFCFFPGTEFEGSWVVFKKRCPFSLPREDEASNSAGRKFCETLQFAYYKDIEAR